jgi:hypothetical protein
MNTGIHILIYQNHGQRTFCDCRFSIKFNKPERSAKDVTFNLPETRDQNVHIYTV